MGLLRAFEEAHKSQRPFALLFRGRPLPTGWVGVSIMRPAETEAMVSQKCVAAS